MGYRLEFIMMIVFSMLNSSSESLQMAFQDSISTLLPMMCLRVGVWLKFSRVSLTLLIQVLISPFR